MTDFHAIAAALDACAQGDFVAAEAILETVPDETVADAADLLRTTPPSDDCPYHGPNQENT